jgi:hypothetical protein
MKLLILLLAFLSLAGVGHGEEPRICMIITPKAFDSFIYEADKIENTKPNKEYRCWTTSQGVSWQSVVEEGTNNVRFLQLQYSTFSTNLYLTNSQYEQLKFEHYTFINFQGVPCLLEVDHNTISEATGIVYFGGLDYKYWKSLKEDL